MRVVIKRDRERARFPPAESPEKTMERAGTATW
jgi:hypothetical protein